jgi:1,4-alpha-glucan branching enzyme
MNATPVPRPHHPVFVPQVGTWRELLNSDGRPYGGGGWSHPTRAESEGPGPFVLHLDLPPLSIGMWAPLGLNGESDLVDGDEVESR